MSTWAFIPAKPPPWWRGVLIALGASTVSLAARAALTPVLLTNLPFVTCFAAVLAATIWGGWLGGAVASVLCGVGAEWAFLGQPHGFALGQGSLWGLFVFFLMAAAVVTLAQTMVTAVRREADLKQRLAIVGRELQHRAKNGISLAIAVVELETRNAASAEDLRDKVVERFHGFARVQDLIDESANDVSSMTSLVRQVLTPFDGGKRIVEGIDGPDVALPRPTAVALSLVLNELATNATKYGALSAPGGAVDLRWTARDATVRMLWKERGGPPVSNPSTSGFGSRLLRSAFSHGKVEMQFDAAGVTCEIEFSLI